MFVMTLARTIFLPCVPLFIMLTGYLTCQKELSAKYYLGIIKVLKTYLIVSIICIVYRNLFLQEGLTIKNSIVSILKFSAAPYSWYVKMYIGLFMLIPFLNILYRNMDTKKKKLMLIGIFVILTVLPSFRLLPSQWSGIYPITYFLLGAYMRDNKLPYNKRVLAIGGIVGAIGLSLFNFFYEYGTVFVEKPYTAYSGFECMFISVLIFAFCLKLDAEYFPHWIKKILTIISKYSFGMYLSSWIIDVQIYGFLNNRISNVYLRLNYAPIVVICVIFGSLLISYMVKKIEDWFDLSILQLRKRYGSLSGK